MIRLACIAWGVAVALVGGSVTPAALHYVEALGAPLLVMVGWALILSAERGKEVSDD
jgi:hypothetical protein